jgi:hypothetical protein
MRHLTRSESDATGYTPEVTSRSGANNVKTEQQAEAHEPGPCSSCTSIMTGHRAIGSPYTSQDRVQSGSGIDTI